MKKQYQMVTFIIPWLLTALYKLQTQHYLVTQEADQMFNLGDRVKHKKTGIVGKVIGYGTRQIDDGYTTTLQVELHSYGSYGAIKPIAEDLLSRWQIIVWDKSVFACSLPYPPKH